MPFALALSRSSSNDCSCWCSNSFDKDCLRWRKASLSKVAGIEARSSSMSFSMSSESFLPRPAGSWMARGRCGSLKLFTYAQSDGTASCWAWRFRYCRTVVCLPVPGGPKAKRL